MGADGNIDITDPQDVGEFLRNVLEDAIHASLDLNEKPPDDKYDTFRVILSEKELVIHFFSEDEVQGENEDGEKPVLTIKKEHSHYWDIYNRLVDDFNNGLNENPITSRAWGHISDNCEVSYYISDLDSKGMNYTYWDTEGYYGSTIFDYFSRGDDTAVESIYDFIIDTYEKSVWYDTFLKLFPDFDTFLKNADNYKDRVSTNTYEVWT